ncbi:MAG TPA: hypothetical protein VF771_13930 [Longimicrobiaceae bacterium]
MSTEARTDSGVLAYNAPHRMQVGAIQRVQAVLVFSHDTAEARSRVEEPGEVRDATVEVSDSVDAELRGGAFDITLLGGAERKRLNRTRPTEWMWEVRPKEAGPQVLVLNLYAWVDDAGARTWARVRTFRDTIEVDVKPAPKKSFGERVGPFVEKNWDKLLTLLIIPLGAALWRLFRKKKHPTGRDGETADSG